MNTRLSRIARLPHHVREVLNFWLHDGEPGALVWLNKQPAARALLPDGSGPPAFTEADLAQWREQGFRDWLALQEALTASRRMAEEVAAMSPDGARPLSERLSAWLAVQYVAQSQRLREGTGDPEQDWRRLREFNSDVAALRRGDQNAERLAIELSRVSLEYDRLIQAKQDSFDRWKHQEMEFLQKLVDPKDSQARAAFLAFAVAARESVATAGKGTGREPQASGGGSAPPTVRPGVHPVKSD